jgi:hypothetical protein
MASKKQKRKKLVNLARNKLVDDGMHGSGNADPTKKDAAKPLSTKLYQIG